MMYGLLDSWEFNTWFEIVGVLTVLLGLSVLGHNSKHSKFHTINGGIYYLLILFYFMLVVFRPLSTSDTGAYYRIYYGDLSRSLVFSVDTLMKRNFWGMEIGLPALFYFLKGIGEFRIVLLIITICEYIVIQKSVKEICKRLGLVYNKYYSSFVIIALYGTFYQYIAFRQGISIMFGFMFLCLMFRKSKTCVIFGILSLGCAILFHLTAVYFPVILFLLKYGKKHSSIYYLLLWSAMAVVVFLGLESFFSNVTYAGYHLASLIVTDYSKYEDVVSVITGVTLTRIVCILLIFYAFLTKSKKTYYWRMCDVFLLDMVIVVLFGSIYVVVRFLDIGLLLMAIMIGEINSGKQKIQIRFGINNVNYCILVALFFLKVGSNLISCGYI